MSARPILFAKHTECSNLEGVLLEVGSERLRAEGESSEARLRLRTELIQVAAVAVAWAESL